METRKALKFTLLMPLLLKKRQIEYLALDSDEFK